MAAEEAAQEAARVKDEQPLTDALEEFGFSASTAKEIRDYLRTPTVKALRALRLSSEDVIARLEPSVRQKRMMEGEQRRFVRYVRELDEPAAAASVVVPAAAAPGKVASKAAAKSKAKTAAPAAKAALLAMASSKSKGGGRGGYSAAAKESTAKEQSVKMKKSGGIDGVEIIFRESLPDNAFSIIARFLFGV
jgi:hypothetical protein